MNGNQLYLEIFINKITGLDYIPDFISLVLLYLNKIMWLD